MTKQKLIAALIARREASGLSGAEVAQRSGLTERSVRNALGPQGNPQMSSLLALVDALGLELQLVPKGFGASAVLDTDAGYRPVATRVGTAVAALALPPEPPPYLRETPARRGSRKRSP
ncbi:helix-turn-helix domain-containing protein [Variovorax sp.]|jgi:HTH-type transcriptional regulator / antitoxin HipB|uniref:helix-turn-helix domain-containing protein n=1 Tax=Variovorax sp. TaxID=1871043 RepID=UPI001218157D|nr:helix-turn-helix domain-containing protein [Variovorax sp.]TAJ61154.1 MAG: transcriptional regulator [Variovorax sp.]